MAGDGTASGFDATAFRDAIHFAMITDCLGDRFASKVRVTPDCWLWLASTTRGYGAFWRDGGMRRAHRLAYEAVYGLVPEGLVLDHRCENPLCVRPTHLRAVTQTENLLASPRTLPGQCARLEACKHGHSLLDPANVYVYRGTRRMCRTCQRNRDHQYYAEGRGRRARGR